MLRNPSIWITLHLKEEVVQTRWLTIINIILSLIYLFIEITSESIVWNVAFA